MSTSIIVILLLLWNTFVSYCNARVAGTMWRERNMHGTFAWLLVWSAAIQAVIGFSMPIIMSEILMLKLVGASPAFLKAAMNLWYVTVIFPILSTGTIITIYSWREAYRTRNWLDMASAGYNTVAMAHNLYSASQSLGGAFSNVMEFVFSGADDEDGFKLLLVKLALFLTVGLGLFGGFLITQWLMKRYENTLPIPETQAA